MPQSLKSQASTLVWHRRRRPVGETLWESACGRYRVRQRTLVCGVKVPAPPWYPLVLVELDHGRQMWDFVCRAVRHRKASTAMAACERHAKRGEKCQ